MNEALVVCVLGVAALALIGLVVRELFLGYPPPSLPHGAALSAKEQAFLAACADALFPPGGPIPVSGTEAGLVAYIDAYVRRTSPGSRALLRLLFAFAEHGPWIFGPRRARFTRLGPEQRVAALADMATSSIYFRRVAFLSLRTMLSMGYLANDVVARRIGVTSHLSPFEGREARAVDAPRKIDSIPPTAPEAA